MKAKISCVLTLGAVLCSCDKKEPEPPKATMVEESETVVVVEAPPHAEEVAEEVAEEMQEAAEVAAEVISEEEHPTPGERVDQAIGATGRGLQTAGEKTAQGVSTAAEKTEQALHTAGEKTEEGVKKAAKATGNFLKKVGEKIEDAAHGEEPVDEEP